MSEPINRQTFCIGERASGTFSVALRVTKRPMYC